MKEENITYVIPVKRLLLGAFVLLGIFLTAGCSGGGSPEDVASYGARPLPHASIQAPPDGALLLNANTNAGDALAAQALSRVGSTSSIIVASMVELDNLEKSSPFGQLNAQQIGSRLSQHGFKVLEARLASELRLQKRNGEFMLTRESAELLARNHDAHAALIGVYSEGHDKIYISTRIVRLNDNALIAAYEYYLPKRGDVLALLNANFRNPSRTGMQLWYGYAKREQAF